MTKTLLSLSALIALASSLSATNQYKLGEISVTAAQNTELNKEDVPDSVTIITKEAIEEARVNTLAEALYKLGNIAMTNNGGPGRATSMYIRGMSTQRTLVLIDGARYNNVTSSNGANYAQMMLYNVERIEIIKGAQSGIWGADASAGVINIVTSKAKKGLHGAANIEYGSFDTKTASLQASYATDSFDAVIGGAYFDTDGFSAYEPAKSDPDYGKRYDELGLEKDRYENRSLNAKLGYNITDKDRIEASVQAINGYVMFDGYGADKSNSDLDFYGNPYYTNNQDRFYRLAYTHDGATNDITLQYNLSTFDRSGNGDFTGSVSEVKLDDKITYREDSFLLAGASYQNFKNDKANVAIDKEYDATSAFVTNYNHFTGINTILTESVRYDKYSDFNNALTGKVGLKQYITDTLYAAINAGSGYNIPSSFQLYDTNYGNLNLEPEKTETYDITFGTESIWITGFYNKINNLIDFDLTTYRYTNISGTSTLKGVELGYKEYFADSIGVTVNYTYLNTRDGDGNTLARRPKNQADAAVVYYVSETFDLGLNGQYIGERYDRADEQGAMTGKYAIVNFVSNVTVNDYITVYGKVDNITDKYYQTVDGYATAGRSLYMGLNAKY